MKQGMQASKIQLRASILQQILKFKSDSFPSDNEIEDCIKCLNEISDKDFLVNLLVREISGSGDVYDSVLSVILLHVSQKNLFQTVVLETLADRTVSDVKKLYLINILREHGQKVDYDLIQSCVDNPDDIIEFETRRFLEEAISNPETQVDFFDFYFTVNQKDKDVLINSIMEDYSGDELANIFGLFVYFYPKNHLTKEMLEALAGSKSYLALEALSWFVEHAKDSHLHPYAKKALAKLKLSGVFNVDKLNDFYSQMLKKSKPLRFYYSLIDGNSNISCVFVRKKENDLIQTFFTVFNLTSGAQSTFGFNEVSKDDFDVILNRFFKSTPRVELDLAQGKRVFDELSKIAMNNIKTIPYEFVCWRRLTFDIKPADADFNELLLSDLNEIKVSPASVDKILNSKFHPAWFYNYSSNKEFASIVDKIKSDKVTSIEQIDLLLNLTCDFLLDLEEFRSNFKQKLLFQAYLLKSIEMPSAADVFYSISRQDEMLKYTLDLILKRSLYEHCLLKTQNDDKKNENIFTKKNVLDIFEKEFYRDLLKEIEKAWVKCK